MTVFDHFPTKEDLARTLPPLTLSLKTPGADDYVGEMDDPGS